MTTADEAIGWYQRIYDDPEYRMGQSRKNVASYALSNIEPGSLLDVGCGRGEMLSIAQNMGFSAAGGEASIPMTDGARIFEGRAQAIPFPDKSFDVVTMFDVLEHIPEADILSVLSELQRVARKHIIITASNLPSYHKGRDLHITKNDYPFWDEIFKRFFDGVVTWQQTPRSNVSELWSIHLNATNENK